MKNQFEREPNAGVPENESGIQQKKITGRSAFSLLIIMAGLSMMSFVQDENTVHRDANVNTGTAPAYTHTRNCCTAETVNPAEAAISFTAASIQMHNADLEHVRNFAAEEKERRIWSMNLVSSRAKADNEALFNFSMSMLYPEAGIAAAADAQMIRTFGEDLLQQEAKMAIAGADAEAQNKFRDDNFTINMHYATADADAAMLKIFEDDNYPHIAYPSAAAIASAAAVV